ncbi:MAG: MotA/TolQ/ExbB proton channel family protein [Candidatus Melainabacteria bacterium]|nr:MotA/TolQ/ExbB proton channel family protein [Candidatus Melainabacteria bacterium]
MEKTTGIGVLLGVAVLLAAFQLGGIEWQALIQPEAWLIVFGGTCTSLMVSFSWETIAGTLQSVGRCFRRDGDTLALLIDDLTAMAAFVRREGTLALEPFASQVTQPFLRKGLLLLVDQTPPLVLRETLATDLEVHHREQLEQVRVLEAAGGYAPTMGLIGALIGLIHVVQSFENPTALGQGVASAFSATLLGITVANLLLLPLATKLRQRIRTDWMKNTLMLQGLISIQAGEHPLVLEEKLRSFLRPGGSPAAVQPALETIDTQQQPAATNHREAGWTTDPSPSYEADSAQKMYATRKGAVCDRLLEQALLVNH